MRFIVLALGLLAALGAAGSGVWIYLAAGKSYEDRRTGKELGTGQPLTPAQSIAAKDTYEAGVKVAPFLFFGAFLAVVGSILAVIRCKKSAAALFLVAAIGPPLLAFGTPLLSGSLLPFTVGPSVLLVIVGILALLIGPKKEAKVEEEKSEELELV